MNETKNKKLLEQFTEKAKLDAERIRKAHDDELKRLENDYEEKIDAKKKRIT